MERSLKDGEELVEFILQCFQQKLNFNCWIFWNIIQKIWTPGIILGNFVTFSGLVMVDSGLGSFSSPREYLLVVSNIYYSVSISAPSPPVASSEMWRSSSISARLIRGAPSSSVSLSTGISASKNTQKKTPKKTSWAKKTNPKTTRVTPRENRGKNQINNAETTNKPQKQQTKNSS